jgi:hypothetical protein
VVDLVLDQGGVMHPGSVLDKASSRLVQRGVVNSKPGLGLFVHLIHDLEDGAFLQEVVADLALEISKDFEEFKAIHLRASHEFLQGVG